VTFLLWTWVLARRQWCLAKGNRGHLGAIGKERTLRNTAWVGAFSRLLHMPPLQALCAPLLALQDHSGREHTKCEHAIFKMDEKLSIMSCERLLTGQTICMRGKQGGRQILLPRHPPHSRPAHNMLTDHRTSPERHTATTTTWNLLSGKQDKLLPFSFARLYVSGAVSAGVCTGHFLRHRGGCFGALWHSRHAAAAVSGAFSIRSTGASRTCAKGRTAR
jgi:hypothetical protein